MPGRRSTSSAGFAPARIRGGARSLQVRFGGLLIALAGLAVAPWMVSAVARHSVDGLARTLDLTGSLRYRLRDVRREVADNDATHVREQLAIERQTLDELIAGSAHDGVPPCPTAELCARLRGHLKRLDERLAPAIERSLARHAGTSPEVASAIRIELEQLDQTVELTTELMQHRAAAITGLGTVAGSASLALVMVIGVGVWDVFGRVRRLHKAIVDGSEDGLRAESAGDHELALLAQALADGLKASNEQREAARRRVKELRAEQDAVSFAVERLNEWIAGVGALAPALDRVAHTAGLASLRFDETPPSSMVDAEFVQDGELVIPLAWHDEYLGALHATGRDLSPENHALVATFAQLQTLACLSRRVLAEREHRGEIASSLASVGALHPGPSNLGQLLDSLVRHDQALLDVLDDAGRPQDRFRISTDTLERTTTPATIEIGSEIAISSGCVMPVDACNNPDAGQLMRIPLRVGGRNVGLLTLGRCHDSFSRQECEIAGAVAPVLASALLRMRLTERLRISEQWTTIGAFGRMLADQLRNPLNNMKLQLQLVERRLRRQAQPASDGPVDQLGVVTAEVERIDALLGEYLSLHPASGDQHHTEVNLGAIVDRALEETRELLDGESVSIISEVAPTALVSGNEPRLRQTVEHMIENAVEAMHGREDAQLVVTLRSRGNQWELVVRDNGPGIVDPVAIFAPGYTTKPSGTGMGLALSLHTVLQHHGHLSARIPDGGGAELTLSLPKCICIEERASAAV